MRGQPRTHRPRRLAAAVVALVLVVGAVRALASDGDGVFSALAGADLARSEAEAAPAAAELPGGGRTIFPDRRVVAFYGAPQDDALGALGIGTPARAAKRLERQAKPYDRPGRPVLPAFELIATIAASGPGSDDLYRTRQSGRVVRRYLDAAREAGVLLVLDIQPGRSDFMSEVRAFEKFLREPDVSLALDPEWHLGPGEVPGQTIGSVDASEVNEVAAYLSDIVRENDLPQKLLVVHEFTEDMIRDREQLESHPGVALTLNVDGFGGQEIKIQKYDEFTRGARADLTEAGGGEGPAAGEGTGTAGDGSAAGEGTGTAGDGSAAGEGTATGGTGTANGSGGAKPFNGFKLFYEEDTDLLSPREVLRLKPDPDLIVYE